MTDNQEIHIEEINEKLPISHDQQNDNDERENAGRYKDGDELSLVRVRFPGNSRSFAFLMGKRNFVYGQKVVAMSDRGMDVGYINSFPYLAKFNKGMLPLRSISDVATDKDIDEQRDNLSKQKKAEITACKVIDKLKLDMSITHVEITQFGKKMVFYFTAPNRVDFRDLVKELVGELKMRIELRQISVRDRAAALGSIGACGLATCCSSFLKNYGNVSIKMAKNQNLALIPSKINGVCGQIKCCIKYEDDVYSDKRRLLPREGTIIKTANGDKGKVLKLHLLIEQFDMMTIKGQIRRYARSQFTSKETFDKKEFPERFQHVVNELSQVIGIKEDQDEAAKKFMDENAQRAAAKENISNLNDEVPVEENEQESKVDQVKAQSTNQNKDKPSGDKPKRNRKRRPRNGRSKKPGNAPKDE